MCVSPKYLQGNAKRPMVTFSKRVNERHLIFGWSHAPFIAGRSSPHQTRKSKAVLPLKVYLQQQGKSYVQRFSPQILTQARLERRTAADYVASQETTPPTLAVVGLGSVGSQLTGLLAPLPWKEMRLVDPDVLTLENLNRHFLGISHVGRAKVDSLRALLLDKNPLGNVQAKRERLVDLAVREPGFFNDCDYLLCCIGDSNAETWLGNAQGEGSITLPIFFLWLEPYLAGGHCLYLNGRDGVHRDDFFEAQIYKHNIISKAEHQRRNFTKQEAGCQTSYIPYSNAPLTLFLTRLVSELAAIMRQPNHPSCRFTWVGDLRAIERLGIEIASEARTMKALELTKVSLV